MSDIFIESTAASRDMMQVIPWKDGDIELRFSFDDQPEKLSFFLSRDDAGRLSEVIGNILAGRGARSV